MDALDPPATVILGPVIVRSFSDLALDGSGSIGSGGHAYADAVLNVTSADADVHLGRGDVVTNATVVPLAAGDAPVGTTLDGSTRKEGRAGDVLMR